MRRIPDIVVRVLSGCAVLLSCLIILLAVIAMWKAPIHQFNLWKLGKNFKVIHSHHPKDSKYLLKVRDFGNLFRGASNGCDYLVGELRTGKESQEEIARQYRGLFIKSFDNTDPVPIEVHFFNEENWMDPYHWSEWRDRAQSHTNLATTNDTLYMIFARQDSYPPYGDIRCT